MATIAYLYDTYEDASRVVGELESAGIPHSDISLVANNADSRIPAGQTTGSALAGTGTTGAGMMGTGDLGAAGSGGLGMNPATSAATYGEDTGVLPVDEHTGTGTGASLGTILGGGAGLLAGIGALAIPGVGPVVAAGWLIATLTGAGVGAAAGGVVGSLTHAGVEENDAHVYAEGVRRGGTMVTVRADEARAEEVRTIMMRNGHVDVAARGEEYRSAGWDRFDDSAPAYTGTTNRPL